MYKKYIYINILNQKIILVPHISMSYMVMVNKDKSTHSDPQKNRYYLLSLLFNWLIDGIESGFKGKQIDMQGGQISKADDYINHLSLSLSLSLSITLFLFFSFLTLQVYISYRIIVSWILKVRFQVQVYVCLSLGQMFITFVLLSLITPPLIFRKNVYACDICHYCFVCLSLSLSLLKYNNDIRAPLLLLLL